MARKNKAFEEEGSALGHNSGANDKLLVAHVTKIAQTMNAIEELRGEIKDELNLAKSNGFLKMAVKKAIKVLRMTEEQKQSEEEITSEAMRITALCADLPLFGGGLEEDAA